MTTYIRSHIAPDIILGLSPTSTTIQEAFGIRFYFKGGKDILSLNKETDTRTLYYVPSFSSVPTDKVVEILTPLEKDIEDGMSEYKIPLDQPFLFDTGTKKILDVASFIDFIPYYGISGALFIIENEDGSHDLQVKYITDNTDYGKIQFLNIIQAKRELIAPSKGTWTSTGKKLLTFLTAQRYLKTTSFTSEHGLWDSMDMKLNPKRAFEIPIDLSTMNTTRAKELAVGIVEIDDDYPAFLEGIASDIPEQGIMLSDLLQMGVESFYAGGYAKQVDVQIDLMRDTYKMILLSTDERICFVELQKGIEMSLEQLKEDLQTETIQLVDDLT